MSNDNTKAKPGTIYKWRTPQLATEGGQGSQSANDEEQLRQAAFDEAKSKGYAAGMAQAQQEMENQRALLSAYVDALSQPFEDQNSQLAEYIASLAGKIARSLVQKELRTDPESLMALVKGAVGALNTSAQKVSIHLHPQNAKVIRELVAIDNEKESWNIVDDPLIGLRDCKVSRDDSLVDTNLEERIDLIIAQFLDDEREESA